MLQQRGRRPGTELSERQHKQECCCQREGSAQPRIGRPATPQGHEQSGDQQQRRGRPDVVAVLVPAMPLLIQLGAKTLVGIQRCVCDHLERHAIGMLGGIAGIPEPLVGYEQADGQQLGCRISQPCRDKHQRDDQRPHAARHGGGQRGEESDRGKRHRQNVDPAVEDHQRENRGGEQRVLNRAGRDGAKQEIQHGRQIEPRQEHAVPDRDMNGWCTGRRDERGQEDHRRDKRQPHHAREQHVHADEAGPVVQHDVDLHRQLQGHDQRQRVDRAQQADLRVLPQHVATAMPTDSRTEPGHTRRRSSVRHRSRRDAGPSR